MIRNDDWFDRWPHEFDDDDPDPIDLAIDDELIEDLRSGAMPPTDDQIANILAAWQRGAIAPPLPPLPGESDPAVEDWRIAMHQAARRAGERERRRLRRERWHRPVLWVVSLFTAAAGPLIRLLARLPWKARSW